MSTWLWRSGMKKPLQLSGQEPPKPLPASPLANAKDHGWDASIRRVCGRLKHEQDRDG